MDVAAKDATDSAETVDVVDVTADADAATTDVASAITADVDHPSSLLLRRFRQRLWMRQQRMWQRQLPVDHPSSLLLWWFRQRMRMRQWLWMRMLDNIIFPA